MRGDWEKQFKRKKGRRENGYGINWHIWHIPIPVATPANLGSEP